MEKFKKIMTIVVMVCVVGLIVFTSCLCKSLSDTKKKVSSLETKIEKLEDQNTENQDKIDSLKERVHQIEVLISAG